MDMDMDMDSYTHISNKVKGQQYKQLKLRLKAYLNSAIEPKVRNRGTCYVTDTSRHCEHQ